MAAAAKLALLLLGCVGLLRPVGARSIGYCPEGWSYYKLNCFKYFRELLSWEEAERQCQASHADAHLAWVEDSKEAATLQEVITYYQRVQPVWLGLHYGRESQAWQWPSGDKYRATSGLAGSGAHRGTCAMLTPKTNFSQWSSANCARQHHYICKFTALH